MTGHTDEIEIVSDPPGLPFWTNLDHTGVTPARLTVADDAMLLVSFRSPASGQVVELAAAPRMSRWIWADMPMGGVFMFFVDQALGGQLTHADRVECVDPGAAPR